MFRLTVALGVNDAKYSWVLSWSLALVIQCGRSFDTMIIEFDHVTVDNDKQIVWVSHSLQMTMDMVRLSSVYVFIGLIIIIIVINLTLKLIAVWCERKEAHHRKQTECGLFIQVWPVRGRLCGVHVQTPLPESWRTQVKCCWRTFQELP